MSMKEFLITPLEMLTDSPREITPCTPIKNKLMTCGVSYVYGSIEEMKNVGTDITVNEPKDLINIFKQQA